MVARSETPPILRWIAGELPLQTRIFFALLLLLIPSVLFLAYISGPTGSSKLLDELMEILKILMGGAAGGYALGFHKGKKGKGD